MGNKYYTVKEVAELLQVTDRTVNSYCKEGIIKAHKLRRSYRIEEQDLNEYLNQTKLK